MAQRTRQVFSAQAKCSRLKHNKRINTAALSGLTGLRGIYTKIVKVLSLAATGNSIDAALDEMSKKELEYLLELCEEEKARRQAAKNGGACND